MFTKIQTLYILSSLKISININLFKIFLRLKILLSWKNIRPKYKTKIKILQNCKLLNDSSFIYQESDHILDISATYSQISLKNYTLFEDTLNHHYFRYATHGNLKRHVAATRCKEIFPRMHKCRTHSHKISKETIKN